MTERIYEYILPSAIWVYEVAGWPDLELRCGEVSCFLVPPKVGGKVVPVDGALGNEGVEVGYSVIRVRAASPHGGPGPEWTVPYQAVRRCVSWVRAVGRQYWLGVHGSASRTVRGSIVLTSGDGGRYSYTNFCGTRTPIFVKPLSRELWEWIGAQLVRQRLPAVTDLFFCDAMLSVADCDFVQAVIRLGVVCELELNSFIDDLLCRQQEGVRRLYASGRPPFAWKLRNMPEILGAEPYQRANGRNASLLLELYERRGSAVHKGSCAADFGDVSRYVFAVDNFLCWTKAERARLGIGPADLLASQITHTMG